MPDGWTGVAIGDIADVVAGSTPSTREPSYWGGGIPWVVPSEVTRQEGQRITATDRTITEAGLRAIRSRLLPVDSVLLTSRATVGAVALAGIPMAINQGFAALVAGPRVLPEYLMYWCQANRGTFEGLAGGSTFPEVSRPAVRSVPLLLPPLAEQRRMVDLLGSVDEALRVDPVARKCHFTWRALLADIATEADEWMPLSAVVTTARAGATPLRHESGYYGGSIPWLKSGEVDNPHLDRATETLSERGLRESSAWLMPVGTIVVAMYGQGPTAGNVGYIEAPMASNQAVIGLVPDTGLVHGRFLFHWLRGCKESMRSRRSGSTQPNLNKGLVLLEQVPILDIVRQRVVAGALDALLDTAAAARRGDAAVRRLRSALLTDLLSGDHQIPATYDRFLDGAA
jgi:type I restriction enzyme S subunit